MKNVSKIICINGLYSKKVLDNLSTKFRRSYRFKQTVYIGNAALLAERTKKRKVKTTRLTIRFKQEQYEMIADLALALDTTI
ncbi:hypothetical protein QUF79_20435 [Fictibacillus enclensis]|nr:hypothetical protein [Fictibacillus enclensis]